MSIGCLVGLSAGLHISMKPGLRSWPRLNPNCKIACFSHIYVNLSGNNGLILMKKNLAYLSAWSAIWCRWLLKSINEMTMNDNEDLMPSAFFCRCSGWLSLTWLNYGETVMGVLKFKVVQGHCAWYYIQLDWIKGDCCCYSNFTVHPWVIRSI